MPQFSSVLGQADFALGSVPLFCGSGFEVTNPYVQFVRPDAGGGGGPLRSLSGLLANPTWTIRAFAVGLVHIETARAAPVRVVVRALGSPVLSSRATPRMPCGGSTAQSGPHWLNALIEAAVTPVRSRSTISARQSDRA
jgi:hypothetical protein